MAPVAAADDPKEQEVLTVRLSGGYHFEQLERLLRDLAPVLHLGARRRLMFDMGGLVFIGPTALALLVAVIKRLGNDALIGDGSRMRAPRSSMTNNYLMRMDLFKHLAGVEVDEPFERKKPVGFRPCQHFATADEYRLVAKDLTDALIERCQTDTGARSAIRICLDELTENVIHHADTGHGGFAAAQGWKQKAEFEIGIVDMGVGIKTSLMKNPTYADIAQDEDAIVTALRPRVSSTPERNAGIGLFITKLLLAANGGTLVVRSGYGRVVSGGENEKMTQTAAMPGTLVALRARTDQALDIKSVYRQLDEIEQALDDHRSSKDKRDQTG